MSARILLEDDLDNLMRGACFLASGGGGPLDLATKIKNEILRIPKPIEMVDLEEVSANDQICMVAGVGAPTEEASFSGSPLISFAVLEGVVEKQFQYVIPIETGAVNSLIPLLVTAKSPIRVPLVNADGGGRSFPRLIMSTFGLSKIPCNPAVVAVEACKEPPRILRISDLQALEEQIRGGSGPSALATFVMDGADLKGENCCVPSAPGMAIAIGEALKLPTHLDRLAQIQKILGRKVTPLMLEGKIKKLCRIPDPYFEVGTLILSGENLSQNPCTIKISFVNENIAIQVDEREGAKAPRMFCYLTTDGAPFTNAELVENWDYWKDRPVTLTLIEPAKEINIREEQQHFEDIYKQYFGDQL